MNRHYINRLICIGLLLCACSNSTFPPPIELVTWEFVDPKDGSLPEIIKAGSDGYQLDSNWAVEEIYYSYKWWGLEGPVSDYQVITNGTEGFQKDGQPVSSENVQALVEAVRNLHPSQFILAGIVLTDYYPEWSVELVGVDGQHIILYSASTANHNSAPWNILINGRLYAQYDGSLAAPIAELFNNEEGSPEVPHDADATPPDWFVFGAQGLPSQLISGFTGLLPIADAFEYSVDLETNQLRGSFYGGRVIGGMGHMSIGQINRLVNVSLIHQDGATLPCDIEPIEAEESIWTQWGFSCSLEAYPSERRAHYGIEVEFGTDQGEVVSIQGELQPNTANPSAVQLLPLPTEIQTAMNKNDMAKDLLKDHQVIYASYMAKISPDNWKQGWYSGEVVFAGETTLNETKIPYTVSTPFALENGVLSYWTLSRSAVDAMLKDILASPLTMRIYAEAPSTTLNLWYAAEGELPEPIYLININFAHYRIELAPCGSTTARNFPEAGQPLQAFGFNSSWGFRMADFMLVDGVPMVGNLMLTAIDDKGGLLPLLLPKQLDTGNNPLFDWIGMLNSGDHWPVVSLNMYSDTQANLDAYDAIANALPGEVNKAYSTDWEIANVTTTVDEAGKLVIVSCGS